VHLPVRNLRQPLGGPGHIVNQPREVPFVQSTAHALEVCGDSGPQFIRSVLHRSWLLVGNPSIRRRTLTGNERRTLFPAVHLASRS